MADDDEDIVACCATLLLCCNSAYALCGKPESFRIRLLLFCLKPVRSSRSPHWLHTWPRLFLLKTCSWTRSQTRSEYCNGIWAWEHRQKWCLLLIMVLGGKYCKFVYWLSGSCSETLRTWWLCRAINFFNRVNRAINYFNHAITR